jgi:hypothetical protein
MKAPDKIYITSSEGVYYESDGSCSITEIWEVGEYDISEGIEYIRKDLHDAEIERLKRENQELRLENMMLKDQADGLYNQERRKDNDTN